MGVLRQNENGVVRGWGVGAVSGDDVRSRSQDEFETLWALRETRTVSSQRVPNGHVAAFCSFGDDRGPLLRFDSVICYPI